MASGNLYLQWRLGNDAYRRESEIYVLARISYCRSNDTMIWRIIYCRKIVLTRHGVGPKLECIYFVFTKPIRC